MAIIHTQCACSRLRRASRSITGAYDQALAPAGIRVTQFSVLRTIARIGTVSISVLADEMALDRSTLGRNLGPLQREGLVTLSEGDDLRERSVALTAKARRLLDKALPRWEQAQRRIEALLGKDDLERLYALLARFDELR
jgi:DNA-binding MarR family transcriptional regulator